MIKKFYNSLKFYLEKLFIRGTHYRLLFIAFIIVFISFSAGIIVYLTTNYFSWIGEAIWWAFLRLSDPGYLGDDKGILLRSISTILIILGYVFFLGALIAIMTQWLNSTMHKLESGLTPISQKNHILILGYTNRTSEIIKELLLSDERVKRFLTRIGSSNLNIVILSDEISLELVNNLKEELGSFWDQKKIILRSGTPLRIEHLRRVDFMKAGVIIIPGADFISEGSEIMDSRTIKTLLSISNYGVSEEDEPFPLVVAELQDYRKISLARNSYKGEVELIAGDSVISRLIAQNIRHRGLSYIYSELLQHDKGNEIYVRECIEEEGKKFNHLIPVFQTSILLGVLRKENNILKPYLNPSGDFIIEKNDHLIFIATDYNSTEPDINLLSLFEPENKKFQLQKSSATRKILVLGWNHKFPPLLKEFENYSDEYFEILNVSMTLIEERIAYEERYSLKKDKVKVEYIKRDYTAPQDLEKINPSSFDTIVFLGSIRFEGVEESDARTLLGYLVLRDLLLKETKRPNLVIELMHSENEKLFRQQKGEVIVSPVILSHMLAHVALRKDLNIVFDELFGPSGAEINFIPSSEYNFTDKKVNFTMIQHKAASFGNIALGIKLNESAGSLRERIILNPDRKETWNFSKNDEIIVLNNR